MVGMNLFGAINNSLLLIPYCVFFGGVSQVFVGVFNWMIRDTLNGLTSFMFAMFWFAQGCDWAMNIDLITHLGAAYDGRTGAYFNIGFLLFSLYQTVGGLTTAKTGFICFILVDLSCIAFIFLSFGVAPKFWLYFAGVTMTLTGLEAICLSIDDIFQKRNTSMWKTFY
jgi:succinate-acetate transporter protein